MLMTIKIQIHEVYMAKFILKANYIKASSSKASHSSNLAHYVATRDGVQYLDYISNRNGTEIIGKHGLFGSENKPIVLSKVMEDLENHEGILFTPILSLKREDADRTGFNNAQNWKDLLSKLAPKIADEYKINLKNFHWYAAYHDHEEHPHCHVIIYSDNKNEGFLTQKAMEKLKSMMVKEIFAQELLPLYMEQTELRQELKEEFDTAVSEIDYEENQRIEELILQLKQNLSEHKGKMSYGYLSKPTKKIVDEIVK